MAFCSEIISSAFRRSGLASAVVAISAPEAAVGLERLKGLYERMSNGLLGQVTDYYLSSGNYTAKEGQRIYKATPASVITLPQTVTDDCSGLTRMVSDGAFVIIVDPSTSVLSRNIFNGAMGIWQEIANLTAPSVAPLSGQFEEALKDMLAVLLNDENGQQSTGTLVSNAAMGKLSIASRYQTVRKETRGVYF